MLRIMRNQGPGQGLNEKHKICLAWYLTPLESWKNESQKADMGDAQDPLFIAQPRESISSASYFVPLAIRGESLDALADVMNM